MFVVFCCTRLFLLKYKPICHQKFFMLSIIKSLFTAYERSKLVVFFRHQMVPHTSFAHFKLPALVLLCISRNESHTQQFRHSAAIYWMKKSLLIRNTLLFIRLGCSRLLRSFYGSSWGNFSHSMIWRWLEGHLSFPVAIRWEYQFGVGCNPTKSMKKPTFVRTSYQDLVTLIRMR